MDPNKEMSGGGRKRNVEKDMSLITQLFIQTIKSNRHVNYQPYQLYKNKSDITRETPLSVGLGLHIYQKTRSKTLLDALSDIYLKVPYEKICSIKNDSVTRAKMKMSENGGIYVPPSLSPNTSLYFAIENVDTQDGKEQLPGTTLELCFNKKILTGKKTQNVLKKHSKEYRECL